MAGNCRSRMLLFQPEEQSVSAAPKLTTNIPKEKVQKVNGTFHENVYNGSNKEIGKGSFKKGIRKGTAYKKHIHRKRLVR